MIEFWQEFSPLQFWYNKLYKNHPGHEDTVYEQELFRFITDFNGLVDYSDLELELPQNMPLPEMASNPITISFLQFLIKMTRAHQVLEIGSYIGISAIKMAQVMPSSGYLITIEKGKQFAELARANVRNNPTKCHITVAYGDALEHLSDWQLNPFNMEDLIYLDADKEHYDQYLEPLSELLRPGGLLVVDDVLFHGDVLNENPITAQGKGVKAFLEKATALDWPKSLLPVSNGVLLLQRPL